MESDVKGSVSSAFQDVSPTVQGHFLLNFYAAVFWLINHIRRLSDLTEENLERFFEKYPFLVSYLSEMRPFMPEDMTWEGALEWWQREIGTFEKDVRCHLPLLALAQEGGLTFHSRLALMIVGLVEEDYRFGTLFAELQEPLAHRRPCLQLVGQIVINESLEGEADPWSVSRPLFGAGLLEVPNRDAPRSEWLPRVPSMLWDVVRGEFEAQPVPWCRYEPPEAFPRLDALILPQDFQERLAQVPALAPEGKAQVIVLRATQGSDRLRVTGAVARAMGLGVVAVDGAASIVPGDWERLGPYCAMTRSMPVIIYDLGPGETARLPQIQGYNGPVGVIMGLEGGLWGWAVERSVTLTLPSPRASQRLRCWQEELRGHPVENLAEISERFHMPNGYIRQAANAATAHAALDRRQEIRIEDVREASRSLNRQLLDTLATRLEVEGTWDHLVVSDVTTSKLQELEKRCRHRERLLDYLSPGFGATCNRGVRALFSGPSGTGKTLAARILAAELGMDLYRVDLAAVVNKYIGETEKNLQRVLSRAEELDVILLLDEGDALLGNRTEVKSANDRYANLETNYLLQKLENYQGIVVVTTNAGENIDSAFQRRMDIVIDFMAPEAGERWHIWQLHLPEHHAVDQNELEAIAVQCALNGGQIRNAALHATLLALDDGSQAVGSRHIKTAILSEYRKAGATCPLDENGRQARSSGSVEAFLNMLSQ